MLIDAAGLFLLGLTYNLSFCLLTCNPLIVSYILSSKKNRKSSRTQAFIFSLSRAGAHFLIALFFYVAAGKAAVFFTGYARVLGIIAGGFIVTVGIFMLFNKTTEFCFLKSGKADAFTLGALSGISPCAPHIAVWSYIALRAKSVYDAAALAFSFSLAEFIVPFILGAAAGRFSEYLTKERLRYISKAAAVIFILIGIKLALR